MSDEELYKKAESVLLSCKTKAQLFHAYNYTQLVYRKIFKGHTASKVVDEIGHISNLERAIGIAQCRIKHGVDV